MLISCKKKRETFTPPSDVSTSNFSKISVKDGKFKNENGDLFFPWGLNYTNPDAVGLIEDDWFNSAVWKIIKADFIEMKALGANVIRIHLQYHQFMTDAETPDAMALNRLLELVEFAESQELYLDVTGLAAYRIEDQPEFYTVMTDQERRNTQKIFWRNVVEKIGDNPAVFAFNLMNEPVISVGCTVGTNCEWTPGDGFEGFYYVQNITRTPDLDYASTTQGWLSEMTQIIRSQDKETTITFGSLALGQYSLFAPDLDYLSPHIYPLSGEIQKAIDQVIANESSIPQVIEETYNLRCTTVELEAFIAGIDGHYDGLMGHYFGTPIADLDPTNLTQAIQMNFLKFFVSNNPN